MILAETEPVGVATETGVGPDLRFGDRVPALDKAALTPDFEDEQYRVRAIDFDQQSYEGRKNMYLPQFFKENRMIVEFCSDVFFARKKICLMFTFA